MGNNDNNNGNRLQKTTDTIKTDIIAHIKDMKNDDESDNVNVYGSLHIIIPHNNLSITENVIQLQFYFFDSNKNQLLFNYIESYSCINQFQEASEGYYFIPASDNLPELYPFCQTSAMTIIENEIAYVIVIVK